MLAYTGFVFYALLVLKNVTLTAEVQLIDLARERARRDRTTLNEAFREWLARYAGRDGARGDYPALMARMRYAQPGRRFNRDELNARR